MPTSQNRSNCAFRYGFLRLATDSTAQSGIIINEMSAARGYGALGMFELSVVGVPLAILGIAFLMVTVPWQMLSLLNPTCELEDSEHWQYLAELFIPRGSKLIDMDPHSAFQATHPNLEVLELIPKHSLWRMLWGQRLFCYIDRVPDKSSGLWPRRVLF